MVRLVLRRGNGPIRIEELNMEVSWDEDGMIKSRE